MSAVPKYIPQYTVDDYSTWEGDWELWDGIAVSMSPSPFGAHQLVLFNLAGELRTQLRNQDCGAVVMGEIDWIISRETVVRPDVVVLCGDAPEVGRPQARHDESPPESGLTPPPATLWLMHRRRVRHTECWHARAAAG